MAPWVDTAPWLAASSVGSIQAALERAAMPRTGVPSTVAPVDLEAPGLHPVSWDHS